VPLLEVMARSRESAAERIARTSLAFYIRDELLTLISSSSSQSVRLVLACRSGRDAGLAGSTWELVRVHFIVERQHGSSEEEASQREQGGPQRIGAQGRSHARAEKGSPQGRAQAQVALQIIKTKKPA
jgi:hypothetical protein